MTIVIDTNVIISALLFGGKPQRVLEMVLTQTVRMAVSRKMLDEVAGVLRGRKFRYPHEVALSIVRELESVSDLVAPLRRIEAISADPYDNMVLECAVTADADYIVTGDAHLLELKEFESIRIVTPAQFLEGVA
jgi:putative PIN family toxin of toxin-antitoxin system